MFIMGSQELAEFKAMTILSALATEAVCLWDDIAEKLEEDPTLRATLGVTEQELADITGFIRRVQDGAHNHRNDLQRTLEAALSAPVRRFALDEMWEAAEAAHAHLPGETESVLLPPCPGEQNEASTTRPKEDQRDKAGRGYIF